ncbi:hypothetical protein Baya_10721 [Bagarius yarrelli]|uniref:Uncharacterized protein n=1 Tax=Bagarius yarrelli TaxID=175774 RepID=A0A556UH87_BAGYA|nr:hypothetical protein Baya_10721 [Bagarius yarrelli]
MAIHLCITDAELVPDDDGYYNCTKVGHASKDPAAIEGSFTHTGTQLKRTLTNAAQDVNTKLVGSSETNGGFYSEVCNFVEVSYLYRGQEKHPAVAQPEAPAHLRFNGLPAFNSGGASATFRLTASWKLRYFCKRQENFLSLQQN